KYYDGNVSQLNILNEFEHNYSPDNAIWWYTRESFLFRLLNKALRVQNIDLLFLFRFFILDIRQQLVQYQCLSSMHIYRGQLMSNEELQILKNSIGQLVSMNSFLSASTNRDVALFYLSDFIPTDDLQKVLLDIDADPLLVDNIPFANIMPHSYFPSEEEVLIMLGSIFRLIDIYYDENQVYNVRLTLCSNNDSSVQTIIENIREESEKNNKGMTNLLSFGSVLRTMGKFCEAKRYYHRLLNELSYDHEYIADCYYGLGKVANEQGDYDSGLRWHHESLETKIRTLGPNDPRLVDSYLNMGGIYSRKNEYKLALESCNKA
ncbi:unnamed protein product, partial [Adineta ricciae]